VSSSPVPVAPGPLHGIRVLDLTRYLAGPYCTMLLGDMGADVVKLEPPDGTRDFGSGAEGRANYFYLSVNRNKRSATLDLQQPDGRAAFLRLADRADVVVENFRPNVMPGWGLGAAALRARNPRLIYCNISGFGATGPYAQRPGFDQIAQGMSGLMSVTGTEQPTRVGIAIGDILAGIFAAHGIGLAPDQRRGPGGDHVAARGPRRRAELERGDLLRHRLAATAGRQPPSAGRPLWRVPRPRPRLQHRLRQRAAVA